MTVDVPTAALVPAVGGIVWFLLRLTVFDAIKELRASNVRQGTRIGDIEEWKKAHDAVEEFKHRRRLTAGNGIVQRDDETPT
jgi:hypothetical protein